MPAGVSAPASITFLHALKLGRPTFIFTISILFVTFSAVQVVTLGMAGILTPARMLVSLLAMIPILLAMPVGAWIGRRLPPHAFDRAVLMLLGVLAAALFVDALR